MYVIISQIVLNAPTHIHAKLVYQVQFLILKFYQKIKCLVVNKFIFAFHMNIKNEGYKINSAVSP